MTIEKLALLNEFHKKDILLLVREAIKSNIELYALKNENAYSSAYFPVSPVDLQKMSKNFSAQVKIFTRRPKYKNNRFEDMGSWIFISIHDLFVRELSAQNLLTTLNKKPLLAVIPEFNIDERNKIWQERFNEMKKNIQGKKTKREYIKLLHDDLLSKQHPSLKQADGSIYSRETMYRNIKG